MLWKRNEVNDQIVHNVKLYQNVMNAQTQGTPHSIMIGFALPSNEYCQDKIIKQVLHKTISEWVK